LRIEIRVDGRVLEVVVARGASSHISTVRRLCCLSSSKRVWCPKHAFLLAGAFPITSFFAQHILLNFRNAFWVQSYISHIIFFMFKAMILDELADPHYYGADLYITYHIFFVQGLSTSTFLYELTNQH